MTAHHRTESSETKVKYISDLVLEADALPRGCLEAENFDALASAASAFYWLDSAPEKLPLPRLGLGLTASVSPWLRLPWLVQIALVVTVTLNSILDTYF